MLEVGTPYGNRGVGKDKACECAATRKTSYARLAQPGEHIPYKDGVSSSNLLTSTKATSAKLPLWIIILDNCPPVHVQHRQIKWLAF